MLSKIGGDFLHHSSSRLDLVDHQTACGDGACCDRQEQGEPVRQWNPLSKIPKRRRWLQHHRLENWRQNIGGRNGSLLFSVNRHKRGGAFDKLRDNAPPTGTPCRPTRSPPSALPRW